MDSFDVLLKQHKSIRALTRQLKSAPNGTSRLPILKELLAEIEFHTSLEESYVYPILEHYNGLQSWTRILWSNHDKIKDQLRQLMGLYDDDQAFLRELSAVMASIENHFADEEAHVFPDTRILVGSAELDSMSMKLESAIKQRAAEAA